MDDIVRSAMAKWPSVPSVYGWLALDKRGAWLIKGERVESPAICAFIGRNYEHDAEGNWYFQNGPQRVYVDMWYTPWVLRLDRGSGLTTHTQHPVNQVNGVWLDEQGVFVMETRRGAAIVDDRDLEVLSENITVPNEPTLDEETLTNRLEEIERGGSPPLLLSFSGQSFPIRPIRRIEVPARFGFNPHPRPPDGHSA